MSDGTVASLFHRQTSAFAPAVETIRQWARNMPPVTLRLALRQNLEQVLLLKTMDDCSLAVQYGDGRTHTLGLYDDPLNLR